MSLGWEDLELQLRTLPGVVAAGFSVEDRKVAVQLLLQPQADEFEIRRLVAEVTMPVADRPVSVEIAWLGAPDDPRVERDRPRVRLAGVWTEAMSGRIKVELERGTRVSDGSSVNAGARAGAEATLAALGNLGADASFVAETAAGALPNPGSHLVEVALHKPDGLRHYGIARADTVEVAAARATLDALNRHLAAHLASGSPAGPATSEQRPMPRSAPAPTNRPVPYAEVQRAPLGPRLSSSFLRWVERVRPEASRWWASVKDSNRPVTDPPS